MNIEYLLRARLVGLLSQIESKKRLEEGTLAYKNPKYTNGMPGRDWDVLETQLTNNVITEMEQDAVAMIRYLSSHVDKASDSWLFRYGIAGLLTEDTRVMSERMTTKLRNSGSWILGVVARFISIVQVQVLQVTLIALRGTPEKVDNLAQTMTKAELRAARTGPEDDLIKLLITALPKFYQLDPSGLEKFRRKEAPPPTPSYTQTTYSTSRHTVPSWETASSSTSPPRPSMSGKADPKVIEAFRQKADSILPEVARQVMTGHGAVIFPASITDANVDTALFANEARTYADRKRKEAEEYRLAAGKVKRAEEDAIAEQQRKQEARKKTFTILGIIVGIVAVIALLIYLFGTVIPNANYDKALSLIDQGNYSEAYDILDGLGTHKNADVLAAEIKFDAYIQRLRETPVGGTFLWGTYEQNGKEKDGPEDIEWYVIAEKDGKKLVLSAKILALKPFDTEGGDIWNTSTLRYWMNNDFYNEIFTEEEKSIICTTEFVDIEYVFFSNDEYYYSYDKLFILSSEQTEYLNYDLNRHANGTVACGTMFDDWWVMDYDPHSNASIASFYAGRDSGVRINSRASAEKEGVRPAMWIDVSNVP